ncbi:GILT-like protein 3 [Calliphora vicina]|uniref:GILT-like protein 3 n=1 Tax=Calliphora vicina TaxID=7373 RepID=UPI00325A7AEF
MKSIVLLSFVYYCALVINIINCVNATTPEEPKKLQVEIFYETLCPDSMLFIRNQIYTSMKTNEWLPYTDLEFIPYGKVGVWTDPATNITNLYCQHGQRECELNALHACIVEHNTIEEQLEMFNCLLNGYSTDVDVCSKRLDIDVSDAKKCKNTRNINDILKKYGDKTDAIEISFVPSIGLGGVFDPWKQRAILHNFSRVFCRKYKEKFGITLEKC